MVSGFQPCGTLQSCHPTTHREVRSVSCPPPHHLQECWPEPPLSARVGGGSVPPSHVEAPLRSAQPRPWSSPVARVSPGDMRDFPWSLQHRLADARATPRLRFRRSGRIASVGQRLAGLSQEGSLSTSGGAPPKVAGRHLARSREVGRHLARRGAIWRGGARFGAEPGGRAPFGAAGRHLARRGAIWRGRAPFGAAGRHLREPGRAVSLRLDAGRWQEVDLELNGPRRAGGPGIASGRWFRDSIGIGDQPVS